MSVEVVERTLDHVDGTDAQFAQLYRPGVDVQPIPYFGNLARAEVLTLGLNPSSKEFTKARRWPSKISASDLAARLDNYFDSTDPPPHPWFEEWAVGLRALGVSYDSSLRLRAAHIDLSPRATRGASAFNKEPIRSVFLDMLRSDATILADALMSAEHAKCVLAAGSATGVYYINEFIDHEVRDLPVRGSWRRGSGPGQTAFHALELADGRSLPMFFCSTGPTKPGVLSSSVAKNRERIKSWLV